MKSCYGSEYPRIPFFNRHGARIGAALCTISATIMFGCIIWAAIILTPIAIEQMQDRSAEVVAKNIGAIK